MIGHLPVEGEMLAAMHHFLPDERRNLPRQLRGHPVAEGADGLDGHAAILAERGAPQRGRPVAQSGVGPDRCFASAQAAAQAGDRPHGAAAWADPEFES